VSCSLNLKRALRDLNRSANCYDQVCVLPQAVAHELLNRLAVIRIEPQCILDLGCGTGNCLALLRKKYPKANIIGIDQAFTRLCVAQTKQNKDLVCCNLLKLPFSDRQFDLIYSNLSLYWVNPQAAFSEVQRVLKPDGLFLFSTFGPDTLHQLRASWMKIDTSITHPFLDMHVIGDFLLSAGFSDPVMDVRYYSLRYRNVRALLRELKQLGMGFLIKPDASINKDRLSQFINAYELHRVAENKIPSTWEIVYGHGWGTQPTISEAYIPIKEIKRSN
jgi:malonyl-CoA O-methyltransferase